MPQQSYGTDWAAPQQGQLTDRNARAVPQCDIEVNIRFEPVSASMENDLWK